MPTPDANTPLPPAPDDSTDSPEDDGTRFTVEEAKAREKDAEARAEEAERRLEQAEAGADAADAPMEQLRADAKVARAEAAKAHAEAERLEANVDKKRAQLEKDLQKMGSKRGIETMFRTSYRTNMDLSALADAKANIMISINGLIVTFLIASIAPGIDTNPWLRVPTTVLLLGCLSSLIYAVLAARPRVQSKEISLKAIKDNTANLLFFGNFAHMSRDEFMTGMEELIIEGSAIYRNMIMDIYGVGLVLQKKYKLLRVSYTLFMIGLIVGVLSFIIVFFTTSQTGGPPETTTTIPIIPTPGL